MPRRQSRPIDERGRRLCMLLSLFPLLVAVIALIALIFTRRANSSPLDLDNDAAVVQERGSPLVPKTPSPINAPSASTTMVPWATMDGTPETENPTQPGSSTLFIPESKDENSNDGIFEAGVDPWIGEITDTPSPPSVTVADPNTPPSTSATLSSSTVASEQSTSYSTVSSGDGIAPFSSSNRPTLADTSAVSSSNETASSGLPSISPTQATASSNPPSTSPTASSSSVSPSTVSSSAKPSTSSTVSPSIIPSSTSSSSVSPTGHASKASKPPTTSSSPFSTASPTTLSTVLSTTSPTTIRPTRKPSVAPIPSTTSPTTIRPTTSSPTKKPSMTPILSTTSPTTIRPTTSSRNAPFPYTLPAFRYQQWHKLSKTSQEIAMDKLHYTPITWNIAGGGFNPIEKKGWTTGLTSVERRGAIQLGFNKDTWDCFMDHYRSLTWDRLKGLTDVHQSYKALGWTRGHWESGSSNPESEDRWWEQLTYGQKTAANDICYFQDNWNAIDMNPNPSFFPHPLPEFRYVPWSELLDMKKGTASRMLNYTEDSWNLLQSNSLEIDETFYGLGSQQREGANELGFYPHTWDCHMNHYNAYYWKGFYGEMKLAIEALGWTVQSWDYAISEPATESQDWKELTAKQRAAATMLCYFREVWDDVPITEWYDYEKGVNTAVSPDGPMPVDIDMSIFVEARSHGHLRSLVSVKD